LMVVISIISILATLGYTNYVTQIKRGRDGRRKADLEEIRSALEMYRADNGQYPLDLSSLSPDYISSLPSDPKGYSYFYQRISVNQYELCAYLEKETGNGDCGNNCNAPGNCNYRTTNP